jgi:hypothetical protein
MTTSTLQQTERYVELMKMVSRGAGRETRFENESNCHVFCLLIRGGPVLARVTSEVNVNNPNQNPDQKQDQQREKPQDQQQNQTQKPNQPKQPSEKPDPVGA